MKAIHYGEKSQWVAVVEHKCLFIIKEKKHARRWKLVFPSSYELRQHKKVLGHVRGKMKDLIKKQGELGKGKGQRSIVDLALTESDNEEEGEGHDCKIPTVEYDENTCPQCQGALPHICIEHPLYTFTENSDKCVTSVT